VALAIVGGCQHAPDSLATASVAPPAGQVSAPPGAAAAGPAVSAGAPAGLADVPGAELRDVLSELARAHEQKGMLTTWVAMPLVGPPVSAGVRPFYQHMGPRQAELLKELRAFARSHGIDLAYRPATDTEGRALALMEARQEKLVRSDGAADFDRDMLMQMYNDYEWQICMLQALLPRVKDAGLRGYVEKSLKVHEEGSAEIVGLLKRFKWAG
jgi:hypothetical protein